MKKIAIIGSSITLLLILIFVVSKSITNANVYSGENTPHIIESETEYFGEARIEPSIDELLSNVLNKKNEGTIIDREITEVNRKENLMVIIFTYLLDEKLNHGVLLVKRLDNGDYYYIHDANLEVNTNEPLHYFEFEAILRSGLPLNIVTGYLNEPNISKIHFTYSDGKWVDLMIWEHQKTFTEIIFDEAKVETMTVFSDDGEIILDILNEE